MAKHAELWYTIQPKDGDLQVSYDNLAPQLSEKHTSKESLHKAGAMAANDIRDILSRKIAFLSGGKDARGCHVLTIPNVRERYPYTEHAISTTLRYLSSILRSNRSFTVLLDVRMSSWNSAKPIIRILQYCLRDRVRVVYIVKPEGFWTKQSTSFKFRKYKDRLGFETVLVSADKLKRHIDPNQLTREFSGSLHYDHQQWIKNRISFEKYLTEAEKRVDYIQKKSLEIVSSCSDYSYSGHVTSQTHSSEQSRATIVTSDDMHHCSRSSKSQTSADHKGELVYHVARENVQSESEDGSKSEIITPIPAPRVNISPVQVFPSPVPPPRRARSRSLSPKRHTQERLKQYRNSRPLPLKYEADPPPLDHIYALSNQHNSATSPNDQSKLHQPSQVQRNGPRFLRRRRANDESSHGTHSSTLSSSASVPNLSESLEGDGRLKKARRTRRHSIHGKYFPSNTFKQGERLLEQLSSVRAESGFIVSPSQPLSDEGVMMMDTINKLQNILHELEGNESQNRKGKKSGRARRKTVTGIPEIDQEAKHEEILTPRRIQDNLKTVYDWVRGPGEDHLQSETRFGNSLSTVQRLIKRHQQILSKCTEPFRILLELKSMLYKLSDGHPTELHQSLPQWMISLRRNMKAVEDRCKVFQGKLRKRGEILQASYAYYRASENIVTSVGKLLKVCSDEVSLLDSLDSVQRRLDGLHEQHQVVASLHYNMVQGATSFLHKLVRYSQDQQLDIGLNWYLAHVQATVAEVQNQVKVSEETFEESKDRVEHVLQLLTAQFHVVQAIEWLHEARRAIKQAHRALGKSAKDVEYLINQHENIQTRGKIAHDSGNKDLSVICVIRRNLDLSPSQSVGSSMLKRSVSSSRFFSSNGQILPTLEEAWNSFLKSWQERRSRLQVAQMFHENVERLLKRGSQLEVDLDTAYPYGPDQFGYQEMEPLRQAHYAFTDDVDDVIILGNNLLRPVDLDETVTSSSPLTCSGDGALDYEIQTKLNELDHLKFNLKTKWNLLKGGQRSSTEYRNRGFPRTWVEGVNESTDWIRMKLVQCSPSSFDIGRNLKEARELLSQHEHLLCEVKENEEVVLSLLEKEQHIDNTTSATRDAVSSSSTERKMHRAMSHSLRGMWTDLAGFLARRSTLLNSSEDFYGSSQTFSNQLTCLEQYLKWDGLPANKASADNLLLTLEEMHEKVLDASRLCLGKGRELMDSLKSLKASNPEQHKASFGAACTSIECTLESLVERRKQVEYIYDKRKHELNHALRVREWEAEVDDVVAWFEATRGRIIEDEVLGLERSHSEGLLCHVDEVKEQAQERIERAKHLVEIGREELKAFGVDLVSERSIELDRMGEKFMEMLDRRRMKLTQVIHFYAAVEEAKSSLEEIAKKMQKGKFSQDKEESDEQYGNFAKCIEAACDPVLLQADAILAHRTDENEGAEGVVDNRELIISLKRRLFAKVESLYKEATSLREMAITFFQTCKELTDWTTEVAEGMLSTNSVIGGNLVTSSQFLVWHRLLAEDVQEKSPELDAIVQSANKLLDSGIADPVQVRDSANRVKEAWAILKKKVDSRIRLADCFVEFVTTAEEACKEIDAAKNDVARGKRRKLSDTEPVELRELESKVSDAEDRCMKVSAEGNTCNAKLKAGIEGDDLDVSVATETVSETLNHLHSKKSDLVNAWLSWRYKSSVSTETGIQWKQVEKTINKLMASLENVEQSVFINDEVNLGEDIDSNQCLMESLDARNDLLQALRTEIENTVKLSEMFGLRASPANGWMKVDEDDEASSEYPVRDRITALLTRYQMLNRRVSNYKVALDAARSCHQYIVQLREAIHESEEELTRKENLKDFADLPSTVKKEGLVQVLLTNHSRLKESIDQIMNSVTSSNFEVHQILNKFDFVQPCSSLGGRGLDDLTMEVSMFYSHWKKLWVNYQNILEREQVASWFSHVYRQNREALHGYEQRLQQCEQRLSKCKTSGAVGELQRDAEKLLKDVKVAEQEWDKFADSSKQRLKQENPRCEKTREEINEITKKLREGTERSSKVVKSAQILQMFFDLTEECESWNDDLKKMISSIRVKTASIKTSDEANDLVDLLGRNVLDRLDEQTDRTKKFASIIVQAEENFHDGIRTYDQGSQPFREVMKQKQRDILESVNRLRNEVDLLNNLLEDAKTEVDTVQSPSYSSAHSKTKAEPYDMSVLLDENLKKSAKEVERKEEKANEAINDYLPQIRRPAICESSVTMTTTSTSSTVDMTSSSFSVSSFSDEYCLDDISNDGDPTGEAILTARHVGEAEQEKEDDFSSFLNDFVPSNTRTEVKSPCINQSSSGSNLSVNSRGRSPPPKPPRNGKTAKQKRKRTWQRGLDHYAAAWLEARRGATSQDESTSGLENDSCVTSSDEREKVYYRLA